MAQPAEAKRELTAKEGTSPLDINACVAEMARITGVPLRVFGEMMDRQ